jgi:hypothetical protein
MKVRRREVNIFNMSLLDILCGALGAFCFMMLALFPSYIEAKKNKGADMEERLREAEARAEEAEAQAEEADARARQERADQTLIAFRMMWNTTDDVDLWMSSANNAWWGPKKERLPGGRLVSQMNDSTDGTKSGESIWLSDATPPNAVYRLYGEVVSRRSTGPVAVRTYAAFRYFDENGKKAMGLPEVNYSSLHVDGQRIELGVLTFDDKGNFQKFEWTNTAPRAPGS